MMGRVGAGALRQTPGCFLAFSGEPSRLRTWLSSLVPERWTALRLNRILDCADLVVYASPETPHLILEADKGLLIGRRRKAGEYREPPCSFSLSAGQQAAWSEGRKLLERAWGDYAAFLRHDEAVTVLRSPGGEVAIHYCEAKGVHAYFSHVEIALDLDRGDREPDARFERQGLTRQPRPSHRDALAGVAELLPGMSRRTRDGQVLDPPT